VCCRSGVSVRDALSCRVSMPCPKHTLRIGRVEPAATAPHARVEWVAGVAGLARKLRALRHCQWAVSPEAPPGSRCGLCVARVLHHSRVSLPFFDLHTAGKNSAGAPPIFQREARVASRACLRSSVMKSKKGEPSRKSAPSPPYLPGRWLSLDRPSTGPHEPLLLGRADAGDAPLATDDALDRHAFVG